MENNIKPKQQISTPMAIIVAGFLIMMGIVVSRNGLIQTEVGVSKDSLNACIKDIDLENLNTSINASVDSAMSNYKREERGTPFTVVIGKDGVKSEVRGQESYENLKKVADSAMIGKVTTPYIGKIVLSEENDYIFGSPNAPVTIIEYSDFECPFCKGFHPTIKRIVNESNGNVKWIYRDYPLHQHSFEKLVAAKCVNKIKGNDAYWKYSDLLFSLLKTSQDSVSEQL
jgi:thiol-disulfide isomerase/thioredoxin